MTNNARSRHAVQSRASKIAGRTALGVLGAPVAMLAVAGPASAAALDMGGSYDDNGTLDLQLAADGLAVPGLDALGVPALPTDLPSQLPIDGVAFQGVSLDLLNLGGTDGVALPGVPSLPSVDSLPLAGALAALPIALPDLPSLPSASGVVGTVTGLAGSLPSVPSASGVVSTVTGLAGSLPSVPSAAGVVGTVTGLAGSLPSVPSLPSASGVVSTVTGLAGGLPTSTQLDLDSVSNTVSHTSHSSKASKASHSSSASTGVADIFSATDLVQGLI
jgi:hypothetical protein